MAQHKQAEKRARQALKREARNTHHLSVLKNALKKFRALSTKKDAQTQLPELVSVIDKSLRKNIIHQNTAARYKSRLTRFANALK